MSTEQSQEISPLQEFRGIVDRMGEQFLAALPAHIAPDKFKRTVITAVTMEPKLLNADRRTLLASCMKAASDGLLLDGRDAALVVFNSKANGPQVQYMPMIGGILKRMRQSGEVKSVGTACVHTNDHFEHWTDEHGEHLTHRPAYGVDRGPVMLAYAIIRTHEEGAYIEVMDAQTIEKVRAVSRAKDDGPWVKWWDEMARKTVLRRLAKRAPMSTDLSELLERDDALTDFSQVESMVTHLPKPTRPTRLAAIAEDDAPAPAGEASAASGGGAI